MLPTIKPGDQLQLRKPHPCGSYKWNVVQIGGDIRIECLGCGRQVLLPRRKLNRRIKYLTPKEEISHSEE